MPPKVIVRDLEKRYGGVVAASGISFTVEAGEVFGLLGPNGAGKTTTVECLIGLREPDAGYLEVAGLETRRQPAEVKQRIGVALQSTALPDKITPREAVRMFGAFYRQRVPAEELLARFALTDKAAAPYDALSGGQRQRLALALAFVNRPEVVVLDEPTTGLDPQARRDLLGAIARLRDDGCTVLFTTHYLAEAEELCDRVAIVDRGRVVAIGAPRELAGQTGGRQTVALLASRPLDAAQLARLPGVQAPQVEGARARFETAAVNDTLRALLAWLAEGGVEIVDLQVRRASLEEVFLRLTHEEEAP